MGKTYNIARRFKNLLTFSVRRRPGKSSNILISFFLLPLSFFLPSLIPFWANRDCEAHTMWFNGQLVKLVDIGLVHVVCGINTRFTVWKLSLNWGLILTAYRWATDIPNSLSWTFVFWIDSTGLLRLCLDLHGKKCAMMMILPRGGGGLGSFVQT